MRRREFIKGIAGTAGAWPLAAGAQPNDRVRHIGVLDPEAQNDPESQTLIGEFTQRLQELGWTSGRNVRIDFCFGGADMRRREFITLVESAAVWPLAARAQQSPISVIGYLHSGSPSPYADLVAAFHRGLSERCYLVWQNVRIEYHWAAGSIRPASSLGSGPRRSSRGRSRRSRRRSSAISS